MDPSVLVIQKKLITVAELHTRPPQKYLLDEIIPERTIGMMYGAPFSYKSFLAMDWAFRLSEGLKWEADGAYAVEQANVIYVAGEGSGGLSKRAHAWEQYNQHKVGNGFLWYPEPVNLMNPKAVANWAEAVSFHNPGLIVFDTLAKCAVGGDENSARDMGIVTESMGLLVRELGCSNYVLHHTTKSGEAFRGSSSLLGNVDWAVEVKRSGSEMVLNCEKQKDDAPFSAIRLQAFSVDESLCLKAAGLGTQKGSLSEVLKLVCQLSKLESVTTAKLKAAVASDAKFKLSDRSLYRALNELVDGGFIANSGTGKKAYLQATLKGKELCASYANDVPA